MSYIRTKDGIYEVLSEYDTPENTTLISNPVAAFDVKVTPRTYSGASIRIIYSNEVISQSENLDELCDEFVIDWLPTNHKDIFGIDKYSKKVIESCIGNNKTNVYGAVWCEFGLKYVAKMDSEGKLVLI